MRGQTPWIKASASGGNGGECVEQRQHGTGVEVRDSKHGDAGVTLRMTAAGYAAWLRGAQVNEYDDLS